MGNLTVKESGEMVNIISPNVNKITSFKVHFSPKQEGIGEPSPDNVREIVGWNGVKGYKCGKNIAHIFGYGTQNIIDTDVNRYKTTNTYGTTINTTIFNNPDTPLIIEQSQAPNSTVPSDYQNGYIAIGTDNLIFGQKYNVSFKVSNITNNILNISLNNIRLLVSNGTSTNVTEIIDDVLIFKNITFYQNTTTPKRQGFEIRICGLSFTLSEFMVTAVDNEDFTYEPYQGTELNINWTNNIKQWTYTNSTFDTYSSNIFNGYGNSLWDNAITDIPTEWFGKTLTYSVYIDRAESPYTPYDNARVWFYGDSTTMKEASSAYRITEPSSSGRSWVTFTIPEGTTKLALGLLISKGGRAYNPQLEYGEEPTEYQPYVGDVYGGYVDLVSGELVSSWICSKIKDLDGTWYYKSGNTRFQIILQSNFAKTDSTGWSKFAIAEAYKKSTSNGYVNGQIATYNERYIYIRDDTFDGDVEIFLEAVGDTKIAYELAESTTYQLTPTQLSTLKGQNNFWSNADYVEIEYELTETFDIQKAKRKIILSQPHVESVSGNIVTFDTDMRGKLKECKVYFSPMQEGEGDPSPDNIRNIVGWNGVEEYSCGKNLFNMETAVEGYIDTTGKKINSPDQENMTSDFILVIEGETYTWTHYPTRTGVNYWTGYAFYSSKDMDSVIGSRTVKNSLKPIYITVPTDAKYIRIGSRYLNGGNAQLEKGSIENVSYEPYQATTTSIDWTNDIGTVYGGYVDLVSGELVNEYASIVLTGAEEGWQFYGAEIEGGHIFSNSKITNHIGGTQRPTEEFCTHFPMSRNWKTILNTCIVGESGLIGFTVDNSIAETVEEFTQFLAEQYANGTPVRLVYKIYISYYANYTIYQLTPQQLTALRGTNTIYSNANGQIDIKYWTRFPKINYMKDVQWLDHSYITSAGKLTEESTALSHTTVDSIFLPAGNYRIDGFCYQEPPANSLNCRVHEYSAGGSWIKLITSNAANTMSPYILEFSLDHDSYIKLSLPRLLDAKLIKI